MIAVNDSDTLAVAETAKIRLIFLACAMLGGSGIAMFGWGMLR